MLYGIKHRVAGGFLLLAMISLPAFAQPGVPVLTSPPNGATDLPTTPTLTWVTVPDAEAYNFAVSCDSNFTGDCSDKGGISGTMSAAGMFCSVPCWEITSGVLVANTTYYWHVQSYSGSMYPNTSSECSATWKFTTGTDEVGAIAFKADKAKTGLPISMTANAIVCFLPKAAQGTITLYDIFGKRVLSINRMLPAGRSVVALKEYNLAAGRYFGRICFGGLEKQGILMIIR
jgi:hypothetical protein